MNNSSRRRTVAAALVVLAVAAGCTRSGRSPDPGPNEPPNLRLVSALTPFSACDELQDYLRKEGSRLVGPYGLGGGRFVHRLPVPLAATEAVAEAGMARDTAANQTAAAAPEGGTDYSATNVQEAGVDEPDMVKTDGRRLVSFSEGNLRVVDLSGDTPRLAGSLRISDNGYSSGDLLLSGDRVLVLHTTTIATPGRPEPADDTAGRAVGSPVYPGASTRVQVTVVDIAEVGAPKVVSELALDGSLVAARMVDGVARLVMRSGPPRIDFTYPSGHPDSVKQAEEANGRLVESSTVDQWLPTYSYSEPGRPAAATSGRLGDCREVARPQQFSGLDMVSVVTVDAADPRPGPAATVVGAGDLIYASPASLYVTSTRWPEPAPASDSADTPATDVDVPAPTASDIHKFDISDKVRTRYLASGTVPGQLLNQFSMSEHAGDLRVATTSDGIGRGNQEPRPSESQVSVLRQHGPALTKVGSVGGLGKGERIYAVRFLGDRGYVVTFRQTDPLYVVDLSDPENPTVKGELKIPGYSAYLHPVGEHRLLGVGQEATDQGRVQGTQVSLFDVSDPASPKRLAQAVLPKARSEAEFDHHAFLYWPKTGLTLLPVESYGEPEIRPGSGAIAAPELRQQFVGAVAFAVGDAEVKEIGRLRDRNGMSIRRSLVVGDRVLTVSDRGLLTSDLASLAERAWLAF